MGESGVPGSQHDALDHELRHQGRPHCLQCAARPGRPDRAESPLSGREENAHRQPLRVGHLLGPTDGSTTTDGALAAPYRPAATSIRESEMAASPYPSGPPSVPATSLEPTAERLGPVTRSARYALILPFLALAVAGCGSTTDVVGTGPPQSPGTGTAAPTTVAVALVVVGETFTYPDGSRRRWRRAGCSTRSRITRGSGG